MTKRLTLLLTALTLLVATVFALNGGVISTTNSAYAGGGTTGALKCVYAVAGDATAHPTKWQIRKLTSPPGGLWGSLRNVGTTAGSIQTGSTYVDYEVKFVPTAPDTFTGTNPVIARVSCNQLTTISIKYQ